MGYRDEAEQQPQTTSEKLQALACPLERWEGRWLIRANWTFGNYKFSVNDNDKDLDLLIARTYEVKRSVDQVLVAYKESK